MGRDRLILIGAGVIVIVVACVVAVKWQSPNNADFPDGTWWLCENPTCKAEFKLTTKQISDWNLKHYGEHMLCPKCGQPSIVRAVKCPKCGDVYPAEGARVCPKCGEPTPS
ncbi:MAG TPA: hypothetical protein VFC78_19310 [Tepidisphaeraceae bacterium]|nr:hypothetical protein [Tepidisphaeraceae bacterium]